MNYMKTDDEIRADYRRRYKNRHKLKHCSICGAEFYGTDKQKNCEKHAYRKSDEEYASKRIIKKCKICGNEFYGKNTLCSRECHAVFISNRKTGRIKQCLNCGKQIVVRPCHERDRNFCSRECWFKYKINKPNFKIRKEKHPHWKGGIRQRSTTTIRYKKWRRSVYKRDNYQCVFCGGTTNLKVHHIVAWSDDKRFRFYISNGITLCASCHKEIHGGNFMKPINYEDTKNKCQTKGIRLRKEISERIEELISEQRNRNVKESKSV